MRNGGLELECRQAGEQQGNAADPNSSGVQPSEIGMDANATRRVSFLILLLVGFYFLYTCTLFTYHCHCPLGVFGVGEVGRG